MNNAEFMVNYCPELGIWKLQDCETGNIKIIDDDIVRTFPDDIWQVFNRAQANPDTIQGISFK